MSDHNAFSDDMISRFVKGELSDEETFRFIKQMKEDPRLYEEVRLTEAILRVERDHFIKSIPAKAKRSEDDQKIDLPVKPARPIIPLYRQTWLRVAASVALILGLGWLTWTTFGPEKTMLATTIPVRQSVDGSLGWAPDAGAGQVVAVVTRDETGELRYRYDGDTLKIFTSSSLKPLTRKDRLYLVDDLKNRRLVLVLEGKNYPVKAGTAEETPLTEEP